MDRQFKTLILVRMILEVTLVSQTQEYISIWIGFSIHSGQNSPLSLYSICLKCDYLKRFILLLAI